MYDKNYTQFGHQPDGGIAISSDPVHLLARFTGNRIDARFTVLSWYIFGTINAVTKIPMIDAGFWYDIPPNSKKGQN
jgi:hypothetical protein